MNKTIEITSETMKKRIVVFCDDELNYHINECADGCVEYKRNSGTVTTAKTFRLHGNEQ